MRTTLSRILFLAVALCLASCVFSLSVSAQYFGQNRVRYKPLDFKILRTDHFDIYYYDEERAAAPEIGRMAECWYTRHSKLFNSPAVPPVELGYFYDVGVAWRGVPNDVPRRVVTSHGLVLRFNILGFAIGPLSYAHPNDRPMKDWVWQFVFTPGF